MSIDIGRRNLLRGRISALGEQAIRPPWSLREGFAEHCTRCLECAEICKARIIVPGDGGFPVVDFKRGECTFCMSCLTACQPGALSIEVIPPWSIKAKIGDRCLAAKGITCRSCGDVCDDRAIRFQLKPGGCAEVHINTQLCSGCGACVSVCPIQAVGMTSPNVADQALAIGPDSTIQQEVHS